MLSVKILSEKEKQKVEKKLHEQFGVVKISGVLARIGTEKIFLFHGDFKEEQIKKLESVIPVERIGVYFGKVMQDDGEEKIRLSIEGSQIIKNQITKNIFELNDKQAEDWMMGREILLDNLNGKKIDKGFVIMRYKNDSLGTGKASDNKITNFIPKNRRLKDKN